MKTLIINGSPRLSGDCVTLINEFQKNLKGEVKIISSYHSGISFCTDCRYCKTNDGCAIKDGMEEVYQSIEQYDNIVIASPIYFSELSGSLLGLMSRLQTYFCQRYFRKKAVPMTQKKAVLILSGAQKETDKRPKETANILFKLMNAEMVAYVFASDTDNVSACDDKDALDKARDAAKLLNEAL